MTGGCSLCVGVRQLVAVAGEASGVIVCLDMAAGAAGTGGRPGLLQETCRSVSQWGHGREGHGAVSDQQLIWVNECGIIIVVRVCVGSSCRLAGDREAWPS